MPYNMRLGKIRNCGKYSPTTSPPKKNEKTQKTQDASKQGWNKNPGPGTRNKTTCM
jgi:hypothetical protein